MTNSKVKGGEFERKICKDLSLWLSNGKYKDVLWRSAMSGGRATVAFKKGERQQAVGDVCAIRPEGMKFCSLFYLELKHLKDAGIEHLFFSLGSAGQLVGIWNKAVKEAEKHERYPLLIVRQNQRATVLGGTHQSLVILLDDPAFQLRNRTVCFIELGLWFIPYIQLLSTPPMHLQGRKRLMGKS